MKILNIFHNTKDYLSRYWNKQKTTKYLLDVNDKTVEVGYYVHYMDEHVVSHVVELSASYGCPMKCKFCASSTITSVKGLHSGEMSDVLKYVYEDNNLSAYNSVLIAMAGIGDLYFTHENVLPFIHTANISYPNLRFATSSCCMNFRLFKAMEEMAAQVHFSNIQITHLSTDERKIKFLIPGIPEITKSKEMSQLILNSKLDALRINYLLIKNLNDSVDDIMNFVACYAPVKDKVVVKISTLNSTEASKHHNVESGSLDKAREFCRCLTKFGFECYVFHAFLNDQMNCGQLISERKQQIHAR